MEDMDVHILSQVQTSIGLDSTVYILLNKKGYQLPSPTYLFSFFI